MATQSLSITKKLQQIAGRHHFSNVFDDFMQMCICSFAYGKMEDKYEQVASKYLPEEIKLFAEALVDMVMEYNYHSCSAGSWCDILGNVFEETNSSFTASKNGQFFTPESICNLMANITDNGELTEYTTICDPSSGSSRNLIAHSRLHISNRVNGFYIAQDLDRRCILMSVLNYVMYGMRGIVIHMNTISCEIFGGYRIYLPETGMGIQPLSINECKSYLFTEKEKIQLLPLLTGQLTLL